MRGKRRTQVTMLAFVDLEQRVPPKHPLRTIKRLALAENHLGHLIVNSGKRDMNHPKLFKSSSNSPRHAVRPGAVVCSAVEHKFWWDDGIMSQAPKDAQGFFMAARAASKPYDKVLRTFDKDGEVLKGVSPAGELAQERAITPAVAVPSTKAASAKPAIAPGWGPT